MIFDTKYNVLIVGLGNIGLKYDLLENSDKRILTHSKSFFYHKEFELVGGIDLNKENRINFEEKYKCKSFENIKESRFDINPDIIVVSTPTDKHYENIQEVLEFFKPKIIICEKPLSYKLNEAFKIIELCKLKNTKLFVNYFRRTMPGTLKVLSLLKSKSLKYPFKGICFYSKGFFNTSSHFIDLLQFFFGKVLNTKLINRGDNNEDPEPDFNLTFKEGCVTFLSNKNSSIFINYIDLILQNGKLTFDNGGTNIFWRPSEKDIRFSGYNVLGSNSEVFKNNFDKIQFYFCEQIYLAINGKDNFLCSGDQALETQKVLEQIKLQL
tara:strand:- start:309 stop:1280 length:972 start_codon:yes stop_codon:yes gene_type:complete